MIWKIFKRKWRPNVERISLSESSTRNLIDEIYKGQIDGVIVSDFFSSEELNMIRERIDENLKSKFCHLEGVYSYPMNFARFAVSNPNEDAFTAYFDNTESAVQSLNGGIGLELPQRFQKFFTTISGGKAFVNPVGKNNQGHYVPVTVRCLTNQGEMHTHCGNFFQSHYSNFYEHLEREVEVFNQLSFFVLVQQADSGGDMVLFNLNWESGQKKIDEDSEHVVFKQPTGELFKANSVTGENSIKLNMNPGDILIFAGGKIWHKVTKPSSNRITIGGFIGKSKSRNDIMYFWS